MQPRRWGQVLAAALVLASTGVAAREDSGVTMEEGVVVADRPLKLVGIGLRKKFLFNFYVAGLYAESPEKDPAKFVSSEQVKRIELSLQRDLTRTDIAGAIREGFERNSKEQMSTLKDRLDQLVAAMPDLKFKDRLALTYVPGEGTRVEINGKERARIVGKDFGEALFCVWFGRNPVDEWLKNRLLGWQ